MFSQVIKIYQGEKYQRHPSRTSDLDNNAVRDNLIWIKATVQLAPLEHLPFHISSAPAIDGVRMRMH